MQYKFNDKELKTMLKNLVVVIDTRENENTHITTWLDKKKIKWESKKLDFGDYSCYLPLGSFEGQIRDIYFTDSIVIERKFCIDELAMNLKDNKTNINEITKEIIEMFGEKYLQKVLKTDYNRLKYELCNMNKHKVEFFILLENENFDIDIRNGNYRAQYEARTLYARLKALEREFNTIIRPVAKEISASEIYNTLKYGVRNILKNESNLEYLENEEVI